MKKCFSMLCAVALLIGLMVPVSAAGNHDIKLTVGNVTAEAGEKIFVPISVSGIDEDDTNFYTNFFTFKIKYNTTAFDFGADLNGDGTIADYLQGRTTISETISRANTTADPWKSMSITVGLPELPFASGAIPKFVNGETTCTLMDLSQYAYRNGALVGFYLTVKDDAAGGDYEVTLSDVTMKACADGQADVVHSVSVVNGKITVEGGTSTPTAKTVTYSATNGKVIASLTELDEGTPVASDTITTEAADSDEVYFYFFPDKGYTADGMTVNGATTIGDGARKFTITEDKTLSFEFKSVSGTATASAVTIVEKSADKLTVFGTATGASDFGLELGLQDKTMTKYAADGADGDGNFAITLSGTGIFGTAKTYAANIYADTKEGIVETFTID